MIEILKRERLVPSGSVLRRMDLSAMLPTLAVDGTPLDWSKAPAEAQKAAVGAIEGALAAVATGAVEPVAELLETLQQPEEIALMAERRMQRSLADVLDRHERREAKAREAKEKRRLTNAELQDDLDAIVADTTEATRQVIEDYEGSIRTIVAFADDAERAWRRQSMELAEGAYSVAKDRWTAARAVGQDAMEDLVRVATERPEAPSSLALLEVAHNDLAKGPAAMESLDGDEFLFLALSVRKAREAVTPPIVKSSRELAAEAEKKLATFELLANDLFDEKVEQPDHDPYDALEVRSAENRAVPLEDAP